MVPRVFILAGVCVVVAALYAAQDVLIPVALAVLFTFLLTPVVHWCERLRLNRVVSVLVVVVAATLVLAALGWTIWIQVKNLAKNAPSYQNEIVRKVQRLGGGGGDLTKPFEELGQRIEEAVKNPTTAPTTQTTQPTSETESGGETGGGAPNPYTQPVATDPGAAPVAGTPGPLADAAQRLSRSAQGEAVTVNPDAPDASDATAATPTTQPGHSPATPLYVAPVQEENTFETLGQYLGVIAGPIGTAGIVIVFVIFMLIQREDLRDRMIRLMGRGQLRVTTSALDDAATRISRYMLAMSIVNGTYGVTISIGLLIIGYFVGDQPFPSFVLWGLLCAVLRFIPYIGPWVAAAFPILLSLAVYEGFSVFFWTLGMFVVVELASNNLMEPWLYGSSTGMSTLAVLISAVFWTWLWGPIGLLLATPLTTVLVVLGKHVPPLAFLDVLLGDEPVLDPPSRVYQRLLAGDAEEASELVHEFHKKMDLPELYDTVLLPALAMAEQDRHAGQLEPEQQTFVHATMRDLVEEMGDQARQRKLSAEAEKVVEVAKGQRELMTVRQTEPCKILCLPASDEADEIVGTMLAQILTLRDYVAESISTHALAAEMLKRVEDMNPEVVVVSALPPSATTRARYLCKRLHAQAEQRGMIVGLWTVRGDLKRARERLTCVASVQVVTTLPDALDQIRNLVQRHRIAHHSPDAAVPAP